MRRIFVIACTFAVIMASFFVYQEYRGNDRLRKMASRPLLQATPRTVTATSETQQRAAPSGEDEILEDEDLPDHSGTTPDIESKVSSSSETLEDEFCCEDELLPVSNEGGPLTWREYTIKDLVAKNGDIPAVYRYVDLVAKHARAARQQAEISPEEYLETLRLGAMLEPDPENREAYEAFKRQIDEHGFSNVRIFSGMPNDPPPHETGRF